MTRSLSDLLTVYVLAREAGLVTWVQDAAHGDGLACVLPVVPLLETIGDLRGGADILAAFVSHPVTMWGSGHRLYRLSVEPDLNHQHSSRRCRGLDLSNHCR